VYFLFANPVSDKELAYKTENGFDKLSRLLEKENIDIFDIERKSIL
jgi:hypothetical protein